MSANEANIPPASSLSAHEVATLLKVLLVGDPSIGASWVDVHMSSGNVRYLVIIERDTSPPLERFEVCCRALFGERMQTVTVDAETNPYRAKPAFYIRVGTR